MFAGIVTALGRIEATPVDFHGELVIAHLEGLGNLSVGDSVAVNGCCLTVVRLKAGQLAAQVIPETMRRANLDRLSPGDRVNLEAPLALGAPVGGHLVTGHVDASGEVTAVSPEQNAVWVTVRVPNEVGRFCVPQGSIAIDGCSLTVVAVEDSDDGGSEVAVSLIPHTVKTTIAANYQPGSVVNLEADSVAKLLERLLAPHLDELTARRGTSAPISPRGS